MAMIDGRSEACLTHFSSTDWFYLLKSAQLGAETPNIVTYHDNIFQLEILSVTADL